MGEDYIFWLRLIFSTSKPINIVYSKVYHKGADTTSSSFVWTIDYASKIHSLRMQSIPKQELPLFIKETIEDRICNIIAVAVSQPQSKWKNSPFYIELQNDMKKFNYQLRPKQRLFLSIPSLRLRKMYSFISNIKAFIHKFYK